MSPKFFEANVAMNVIWNWQSSPTNYMSHILGEVGAELKLSI